MGIVARRLVGLRSKNTNLAHHPASLHGRGQDLVRLADLMRIGARLISLHGPPGVGKSRLACRFALSQVERLPGGAWRCSLVAALAADDITRVIGEVRQEVFVDECMDQLRALSH